MPVSRGRFRQEAIFTSISKKTILHKKSILVNNDPGSIDRIFETRKVPKSGVFARRRSLLEYLSEYVECAIHHMTR